MHPFPRAVVAGVELLPVGGDVKDLLSLGDFAELTLEERGATAQEPCRTCNGHTATCDGHTTTLHLPCVVYTGLPAATRQTLYLLQSLSCCAGVSAAAADEVDDGLVIGAAKVSALMGRASTLSAALSLVAAASVAVVEKAVRVLKKWGRKREIGRGRASSGRASGHKRGQRDDDAHDAHDEEEERRGEEEDDEDEDEDAEAEAEAEDDLQAPGSVVFMYRASRTSGRGGDSHIERISYSATGNTEWTTFTANEALAALRGAPLEALRLLLRCADDEDPWASGLRGAAPDARVLIPPVSVIAHGTGTTGGPKKRWSEPLVDSYNRLAELVTRLQNKTAVRHAETQEADHDAADAGAGAGAGAGAVVSRQDQLQLQGRVTAVVSALSQQLRGKENRIRANLRAKRVDESARTVLTGDPTLGLDEIGIPARIAEQLVVSEVITVHNKDRLLPPPLPPPPPPPPPAPPAAPRVSTPGSARASSSDSTAPPRWPKYVDTTTGAYLRHPSLGDTALRPLRDGDVVLFNRCPSLHAHSLMAHRARIMPQGDTLRLPLAVTPAYNADFDGDEGHLFAVGPAAAFEAAQLMLVRRCAVSAETGGPVMGAVQNTVTAAYLMSGGAGQQVLLDRPGMSQILAAVLSVDDACPKSKRTAVSAAAAATVTVTHHPAAQAAALPLPAVAGDPADPSTARWTGHQALSLAFPPDFNYGHSDLILDVGPSKQDRPLVERGKLVRGVLRKRDIGAGGSARGILGVMWRRLGADAVAGFLDRLERVTATWLDAHGFSFGMRDLLRLSSGAPRPSAEDVEAAAPTNATETEVVRRLDGLRKAQAEAALEAARRDARRHYLGAGPSTARLNALVAMLDSGAKGSVMAVAQMACMVGQQTCLGRRMDPRLLPSGRTLTDAQTAKARGFIARSMLDGMDPGDAFLHAAAGRINLTSTTTVTRNTGYLERRLRENLQDLKVAYDGTVRDSAGRIVSFRYGGDGLDGTRAVDVDDAVLGPLSTPCDVDHAALAVLGAFAQSASGAFAPSTSGAFAQSAQSMQTMLRDELCVTAGDEAEAIARIAEMQCVGAAQPVDGPLLGVSRIVRDGATRLTAALYIAQRLRHMDAVLDKRNRHGPPHAGQQPPGHAADDEHEREKQVQARYLRFGAVLEQLRAHALRAAVHPGTPVGIIAAQSASHSLTQGTLDSFKSAGQASEVFGSASEFLKAGLALFAGQRAAGVAAVVTASCATALAARRAASTLVQVTLGEVAEPLAWRLRAEGGPQLLLRVGADADASAVSGRGPGRGLGRGRLDARQVAWRLADWLATKTPQARSATGVVDVHLGAEVQDAGTSDGEATAAVVALVLGFDPDGVTVMADPDAMLVDDSEEIAVGSPAEPPELIVMRTRLWNNHLASVRVAGGPGITSVSVVGREGTDKHEGQHDDHDHDQDKDDDTGPACIVAVAAPQAPALQVLRAVQRCPGVDPFSVRVNDVGAMLQAMDVEAARHVLLHELSLFYGGSIARRHLVLIADFMTQLGGIRPFTRQGMGQDAEAAQNALARASFEACSTMLQQSAYGGHGVDNLRSAAARMILGMPPSLGTGDTSMQLLCSANPAPPPQEQQHPTRSRSRTSRFKPPSRRGRAPPMMAMTSGALPPRPPLPPLQPLQSRQPPQPRQPPQVQGGDESGPQYSPTTPFYSPHDAPCFHPHAPSGPSGPATLSPQYSPSSPYYSPTSPAYNPTSPAYNPSSFAHPNPTASPQYSPSSPCYSPTSPTYDPAITSPQYSPTAYDPEHPYSPDIVDRPYSPTACQSYSPTYVLAGGGGSGSGSGGGSGADPPLNPLEEAWNQTIEESDDEWS